jgi:hypothetical protein
MGTHNSNVTTSSLIVAFILPYCFSKVIKKKKEQGREKEIERREASIKKGKQMSRDRTKMKRGDWD